MFFIPAIILLGAGVLCLIFPRQIGVGFCRLGKAIWRLGTLGLTDMRWFYPEDKAPTTFRIFGIALILFSIPWGVIAVKSISGPGHFAAMRESHSYLVDRYGSANSWNLSPKEDLYGGEGGYFVTYQHGEHSGVLNAKWARDHYVISEKLEKREEPARQTPGK